MSEMPATPPWLGAPHRPAVLKWLSKLEEVLGALLVLLIFILLTIQVFQRYLPVATQPWIGEVSRYALMSLGFILVGSLMGQGRHLSIEAIAQRRPACFQTLRRGDFVHHQRGHLRRVSPRLLGPDFL